MKKRWMAAFAVVVMAAGALGAEVGKTPLEWGRLLLAQTKAGDTEYRHKEGEVSWEEGGKGAVCKTDCSGFIDALLGKAYGWDGAYMKKWLGKTRPTAASYYEAIVAGNGFERVKDVRKIEAGDLIAIKYPAGSENTGHIMLVDGVAVARKATKPLEAGTEQWEVTVIDVSESGHGKTDTRRKEDGTFGQGIGRGVLRLYAKGDGTVVGYAWSTFENSVFEGKERALAVGRIKVGK